MAHSVVDLASCPWIVLTCAEDSVDLAVGELAALAPTELMATLAPGTVLMRSRAGFGSVAEKWRTAPPIFVRHMCPAQSAIPLSGKMTDVSLLAAAIGPFLPNISPAASFSVQSRILAPMEYKPFDMNTALAEAIRAAVGARLDVRNPRQALSVLCVAMSPPLLALLPRGIEPPAAVALIGLSQATDNLSSWAGGMRRFAREEGQVSRAEFKLLEALELFCIELSPHGVALDLGAAPGGWTRVLRRLGQYVTAVDPGELDARLVADKGIRHLRMTAQEYLRSDPDQFDIIVNDMRMDARESARLMVSFARCLYPHGVALMTLKLPEEKRAPLIDEALAILRQAYTISGARQLFHNRSEITLYLSALPAEGKPQMAQAQPGDSSKRRQSLRRASGSATRRRGSAR